VLDDRRELTAVAAGESAPQWRRARKSAAQAPAARAPVERNINRGDSVKNLPVCLYR
jgi:hypothetical protein